MAKINVKAVREHKELLIPAGDYEVKFLKVEERIAQTGREWFNITCEFLDTIPSGLEIDEEIAVDPVKSKQKLFKGVFFPMEGDKANVASMFEGQLQSLLNYANCEPASEDEIVPADLINLYCGVKVAHKPINKDDPNGSLRAEIVAFTQLPN